MTADQSAITDDDLSALLNAAAAGGSKEEAPPAAEPQVEAPAAGDGSVGNGDLDALLAGAPSTSKEDELPPATDGDTEAPAPAPEAEGISSPSVAKVEPNTPEEIAAFDTKLADTIEQIESGGTAAEPEPDAAQQPSPAGQEPATAGEGEPADAAETEDAAGDAQEDEDPVEVDGALAESVDSILSALDEPEDMPSEEPEAEESPVNPPDMVDLANLLQDAPLAADEPTAETTADEVEDLLKDAAPAEGPPAAETPPETEAPEEPPRTEPPAPAQKQRPRAVGAVAAAFGVLSATHVIIFINSIVLIVLIVGQLSFQRNANLLNQELQRSVAQTMRDAGGLLERLDAKITLPDGEKRLGSPREYIKLLKAADTAFDKGDVVKAGTLYKEIIGRFPTQDSNDHVSYRLGETYLSSAQPRWQAARSQFMVVIENFPQSQYVALSHLRLAYCDNQLGAYVSARRTLLELLANQSLYGREALPIFLEARHRLAQYYDAEARALKAREGINSKQ